MIQEHLMEMIKSIDPVFAGLVATILVLLIASRVIEDIEDIDNEYDAWWDNENDEYDW